MNHYCVFDIVIKRCLRLSGIERCNRWIIRENHYNRSLIWKYYCAIIKPINSSFIFNCNCSLFFFRELSSHLVIPRNHNYYFLLIRLLLCLICCLIMVIMIIKKWLWFMLMFFQRLVMNKWTNYKCNNRDYILCQYEKKVELLSKIYYSNW